MKANVEIYAYH